MRLTRSPRALVFAVLFAGLTQMIPACGESKRAVVPVGSSGAGNGDQGGAGGASANAGAPVVSASGGRSQGGESAGARAGSASSGAGGQGLAAGAGGTSTDGAVGGESGSTGAGAPSGADGGSAGDGAAGAGPVTGFAADFIPRAQAALNAAAPPWTCATTLPAVPVADGEAVRDVVRAFIAEAMDVALADITMSTEACDTPSTNTCAEIFAHDTASSGGALYDTARPLALELEANTTDVEVTIWVPMKDGMALPAIYVMTGISDGVLVGMAVFNSPDVCR